MNSCFLKKHRRGYWNIFSLLSKEVPLFVGWGLLHDSEARMPHQSKEANKNNLDGMAVIPMSRLTLRRGGPRGRPGWSRQCDMASIYWNSS
jgi:hypothetical protein